MSIIKFWFELGLFLGTVIFGLFIGLIPNFIFQYYGWVDNEQLDLLSRFIGAFIAIPLILFLLKKIEQ